jgi:2-alkenal reductase
VLAASLVGAVLGGGGTFLALKGSGAFDAATAAPAATFPTGSGSNVLVTDESSAVVAAVQKVGPAVVMIISEQNSIPTAVGSGVIFDTRGWILTNKHVVSNTGTLVVRLKDQREFKGTVYGVDTLTDLAIVKIDGATGLTAAPIGDSSSIQVGETAIAIGSPLGLDYPNSVTEGIVSGLDRDITVGSDNSFSSSGGTNLHGLIQTDAAINPGNSGGPLVDASGRVIGLSTALAGDAQGISFAIPIDIAKPIMAQALAGEQLARPYIGVVYVSIDLGVQTDQKLPLDHGAWIHSVDQAGNAVEAIQPDSPAAKAGLKDGDIITQVEGQTIDANHSLENLLVQYAPGTKISLEVYRDGGYITVGLTLGTRPASTS